MYIQALSKCYNHVSLSITTETEILNPLNGILVKTMCLWDTGATISGVSKSLAEKLELFPVQRTRVKDVHGENDVNVYLIDLILQGNFLKMAIPVAECNELSNDGSVSILVGMDVISRGDFCITNYEGKTTMTFRIPSMEKIIFEGSDIELLP